MKHVFVTITTFLSLILSLFIFGTADAGFVSNFTGKLTNKSFGGKVLWTPIPGVICTGLGMSVVLSSNIGGAVSAARSATSGGGAAGVIGGIYGMIPTYTTNPLRLPQIGGYILGTEKLIPNFTLCKIGDIPIPVLKTTDNYGTSGRGGASTELKTLTPKLPDIKTPGLAPIPIYH